MKMVTIGETEFFRMDLDDEVPAEVRQPHELPGAPSSGASGPSAAEMSIALNKAVETSEKHEAAIAVLLQKMEKPTPESSAKASKRTTKASTVQSSKKKYRKFDVNVYCDCGAVLNKHEMEAKRCVDCRVQSSAVARL